MQASRLLTALSSGGSLVSPSGAAGIRDRLIVPADATNEMPADIRLCAKRGDANIEAR